MYQAGLWFPHQGTYNPAVEQLQIPGPPRYYPYNLYSTDVGNNSNTQSLNNSQIHDQKLYQQTNIPIRQPQYIDLTNSDYPDTLFQGRVTTLPSRVVQKRIAAKFVEELKKWDAEKLKDFKEIFEYIKVKCLKSNKSVEQAIYDFNEEKQTHFSLDEFKSKFGIHAINLVYKDICSSITEYFANEFKQDAIEEKESIYDQQSSPTLFTPNQLDFDNWPDLDKYNSDFKI